VADLQTLAAIELVRPFQTTELWHAIQLVWALPDDAPPERIDGQPEVARAASTVSIAYETMGYMVYARLVPLSSFDELAGGAVRVCWRRLRPWTEHVRQTSGSPNAGEWFQWLAERLAESPAKGKLAGAHIAHRKWRP